MTNSLETGTHFRRTLWRTGYNVEEVDAFTAEVEIALFSPEPRVNASDVATQEFSEVRRWPGYDIQDVDKYLVEAEQRLSEAEHRLDPHPFRRDLSA
jgi:DivIVA domain-containing protein